MVPTHLRRTPSGALHAGLDRPLPENLYVGRGTAIVVRGWCFHSWLTIRQLHIQCGDALVPVTWNGIPRQDLAEAFSPRAMKSGFAAVVPIAAATEPTSKSIAIRATFAGGRTESMTLGALRVVPELQQSADAQRSSNLTYLGKRDGWTNAKASIAICLTTTNPPIVDFARQIAALRAQTEPNWICLINDDGSKSESFAAIRGMLADDGRFQLMRQPSREGLCRTLENCLIRVPREVEFVALPGREAVWQRDALAVLRSRFVSNTALVGSDWRPNFPADLAGGLLERPTFGAVMLRRQALDQTLPFPQLAGADEADSWIACAAMSVGRVVHIAESLCETGTTAEPQKSSDGDGSASEWLALVQQVETLRIRGGVELSLAHRRSLRRALDPYWLTLQAVRHWRADSGNRCYGLLLAKLRATYASAFAVGRHGITKAPIEPRHAA
jgi:hypothetical protein